MKKYVAASIFLVLTFSLVGLLSLYTPILEILELKGYDFMMSVLRGPVPASQDLVVVAIDETSLAEFENLGLHWPWPRSVHGELIHSLNAAGARAIVFDVVFAGETDEVEDGYMADAIRESQIPVVLAAAQETVTIPSFGVLTQQVLPADPFLEAGAQIGYAMMNPDLDEGLRKARLSVDGEPSLSAQCYQQVVGDLDLSEIQVAGFEGEDPEVLINFRGGARSIHTVSYYQALDPQTFLPPHVLKDKIVFVGRSMAVEDLSGRRMQKDAFLVPFSLQGLMPGVEVHANVLETLIQRDFIQRATPLQTWSILILLALAVSGIVLGFESFRWKVSLSVVAIVGYQLAAAWIFIAHNLWLYTAQPFVIMLSVFGFNTLYQYRIAEKERAHVRRALKGYISGPVMAEIMKNPAGLELGGTQATATVLFSDIQGFSKISEKNTPRELFALLNDYFTKIGDAIMEQEGMINKYIGDAVMAVWNAPKRNEDHAAMACQAALEMKRIVDEMHPLKARIGINTGPMMVGNLGHIERMEYTVIGDAVNLASRLEGANKPFGTAIMISEATEELVRGRFLTRLLDRIRVMGKQQPVRVYEVFCGTDEPVPDELHEMLRSFDQIAEAYDSRDWEKASDLAEKHLQHFPEDKVATVYLERCRRFHLTPPPSDWDGVFSLESK